MESKATLKSDKKAAQILNAGFKACPICGNPGPYRDSPIGPCSHDRVPVNMKIEEALRIANSSLLSAELELEARQKVMNKLKDMYGHIVYEREVQKRIHDRK